MSHRRISLVLIASAVTAQSLAGQRTTPRPAPRATAAAPSRAATPSVGPGFTDIGLTVGKASGDFPRSNPPFGLRAERVQWKLAKTSASLGLSASADTYTSNHYVGVRFTPVTVALNVHPRLNARRVDVFAGVGMWAMYHSCAAGLSCGGGFFESNAYLRAGGRYFVTPRVAIFGEAATGPVPLRLGGSFVMSPG